MNIEIKYSHIYEQELNPEASALSHAKIDEAENALVEFWKKNGSSIKKTLEHVTGLSFHKAVIPVYLNSSKIFSDPLTLKIEDTRDMQDNLVHELIHVLLIQNKTGELPGWKTLMERYKEKEPAVKVHIVVHAIHILVAQTLFPDRIERIKSYSTFPTYRKSWEIVDELGASNVVKEIFYK